MARPKRSAAATDDAPAGRATRARASADAVVMAAEAAVAVPVARGAATPARRSPARAPGTPPSASASASASGSAVRGLKFNNLSGGAASPLGRSATVAAAAAAAAGAVLGSPNLSAIDLANTSVLSEGAGSSPARPGGEAMMDAFVEAQRPQKKRARPVGTHAAARRVRTRTAWGRAAAVAD
jgi:hypothetical protein